MAPSSAGSSTSWSDVHHEGRAAHRELIHDIATVGTVGARAVSGCARPAPHPRQRDRDLTVAGSKPARHREAAGQGPAGRDEDAARCSRPTGTGCDAARPPAAARRQLSAQPSGEAGRRRQAAGAFLSARHSARTRPVAAGHRRAGSQSGSTSKGYTAAECPRYAASGPNCKTDSRCEAGRAHRRRVGSPYQLAPSRRAAVRTALVVGGPMSIWRSGSS